MNVTGNKYRRVLTGTAFLSIVIVNSIKREYVLYFTIPAAILIVYLLFKFISYNKIIGVSNTYIKYFFILGIVINLIGGYLIAHSCGIL